MDMFYPYPPTPAAGFPPAPWQPRLEGWQPRIEMYRGPHAYRLIVEVAGADEERLLVTWDQDALFIQGHIKDLTDRGQLLYRERPAGSFRRRVPLPSDANPEQAVATYRDGVLEVELPLRGEPSGEGRTIPIETED
ncbi:MAG: Hsp20/alpha crystallin family protein [Acetobacteraceae bacterium]|nr:Hsp20/alpha crystallin family protein [Acetobacteraceae bacterium]